MRGTLLCGRSRKPSLRWNGPFRVLECRSEHIFLIESLPDGTKSEVHGRRLKFFRNKDLDVTEELLDHLVYQQGELLVINQFIDIRRMQGDTGLLVTWRGFTSDESDWVSLSSLHEDVPELVKNYFADISINGIKKQRDIATSA